MKLFFTVILIFCSCFCLYSEQGDYANKILNHKPSYQYLTNNIIDHVSVNVYVISYDDDRLVYKKLKSIYDINVSDNERCLSNKDYVSIRLAVFEDRKKLHPEDCLCLVIELKDKTILQDMTKKQKTFLTTINGKYRELLPYVIPALGNTFTSDYYTTKEIKKMFGEKFIEDYVFSDKKNIFKSN